MPLASCSAELGDPLLTVSGTVSSSSLFDRNTQYSRDLDNPLVTYSGIGCSSTSSVTIRNKRVTDPTATFTKEQKALDRDLQDLICPRISGTSLDEDDEDERVNDDTDSEANEDIQQSFLKKLITYLHSCKDIQGDSVDVQRTKAFIHRAEGLHLLEPRDMAAIQNMMAYPGSVLARNISMQMSVELKRLYRKGCKELHAKVK